MTEKAKAKSLFDLDRRLAKLESLTAALRDARRRLIDGDSPPGKTVPGPAMKPKAGRKKRKSFSQNRLAIARMIEANGPMGACKLAAKTRVNRKYIYRFLHTDWFVSESGKWALTNRGQEAARSGT